MLFRSSPSLARAGLRGSRDSYPEATFETRELPETATVAGDYLLEIALADDGPGVPDEPEGSAVEMAEHGPDGSAGMGLFLVRSVIDRYGGDVGVTDNDPTGALFSLRFPTA